MTFVPLSPFTPLASPVGIDYHEPTSKMVVSVNYPNGLPHNFELVDKNGDHSPYSYASGMKDEIKIAGVRSGPHQGGYAVGELLTTGAPGYIVRISPDGLSVQDQWVELPNEFGRLRGGLFQDRYGSWGGDLVVVALGGNVWSVKSTGSKKLITNLGEKAGEIHPEGITTVPDDVTQYGPWAGKIVVGGSKFYAIDAGGNVEVFDLGIAPENINIIPSGEDFYGVDHNSAMIWNAPSASFTSMVGDFLVAEESGGTLWHVRWDNQSSSFKTESVAKAEQWEQFTFVPPRSPLLQYAVKFICGKSSSRVVAPGAYYTAINIHNPTNEEIHFRKKFAVALPAEKPGPVSKFSESELGPDQAFEIDCPDIMGYFHHRDDEPTEFLKGFAIIESDVELDIVAVYTAAGRDGQVETLDVERVIPRRKRPAQAGLPDLIPVPDPKPGVGFCRLDDQGRLLVTVKNQGTGNAPASTTTIHFSPGGAFELPTPAIPAGGSVDLPPQPIPPQCYNPDCNFRIIVDSKNQVVESDNGNNFASGMCLG